MGVEPVKQTVEKRGFGLREGDGGPVGQANEALFRCAVFAVQRQCGGEDVDPAGEHGRKQFGLPGKTGVDRLLAGVCLRGKPVQSEMVVRENR